MSNNVTQTTMKMKMKLTIRIRDVADTKMRAWKKQMASLPRHRQLEAERMQVFMNDCVVDGDVDVDAVDGDVDIDAAATFG